MSAMPRTRSHSRGGRPSKGERHAFMSRVPINAAVQLMEEADELDVTYSELIAHIVGQRYGIEIQLNPARDRGQKEIALPETA